MQSFNEAKSYVQNQAFLIVSELCNTFAYRFGGLQDVEGANENHIATKDDVLLLHVNKLFALRVLEHQKSKSGRFLNQNISPI